MDPPCTPGSTVIGPTPPTTEPAQRKLLPTIRPPDSAMTESISGVEKRNDIIPATCSGLAKSDGKPCARLIALNASKQIAPHAAASSALPGRRVTVSLVVTTV